MYMRGFGRSRGFGLGCGLLGAEFLFELLGGLDVVRFAGGHGVVADGFFGDA
jgi:hypothetical protein